MKQPRLNIQDALSKPAARSLFGLLMRTEEPLRVRHARESLGLSIAQFGLAMRALERHGLALTRNFIGDQPPVEGVKGLQHRYIEATDLAREQGQGFMSAATAAAANVSPPVQN